MRMLRLSALGTKSAIDFKSLLAITAAKVSGAVNLWGFSLGYRNDAGS
jgi:hypothetical protein